MKQVVALFGAAGKVGTRIAAKLTESGEYEVLYVERGEAGMARLKERGQMPTPAEQAVKQAELVILAVPDVAIGAVAAAVVPTLRSGTLVMCLDPAAPYAGELPARDDIAYFVVHPCHPPVVNDETDMAAKMDFYGGVKAKQALVCALMQGSDADYARGEALARAMFAPILRTHRITVEQMATLEPAMAETVVLTCMFIIREAMEEAVRHGVPADATRDFLMGHINVNIGILFGYLNTNFSDAALLMVERAKAQLIQSDWKQVFEPDNLRTQIAAIVGRKIVTAVRLGIGSYTYTWAIGVPGYPPTQPMTAYDLLESAAGLGVHLVQFADNLPLDELPAHVRSDLRRHAQELAICIEIGTRGIEPEHLRRCLAVACEFDAAFLRVVIDRADHHPSAGEVVAHLRAVMPEFEAANVTLAIENHDRFRVATLLEIVREVESERLGICLDTVNSFGALEGPAVVVEALGPYTVNLHVKDFVVQRAGHNMGFSVEGRPAGEGQLDVPWLLGRLRALGRDCNAILELWTPPAGDIEATIAMEARWAQASVTYLRTIVEE